MIPILITPMHSMVGEIYRHNGSWKFNAIGNGILSDLAGLCKFYGIETN